MRTQIWSSTMSWALSIVIIDPPIYPSICKSGICIKTTWQYKTLLCTLPSMSPLHTFFVSLMSFYATKLSLTCIFPYLIYVLTLSTWNKLWQFTFDHYGLWLYGSKSQSLKVPVPNANVHTHMYMVVWLTSYLYHGSTLIMFFINFDYHFGKR